MGELVYYPLFFPFILLFVSTTYVLFHVERVGRRFRGMNPRRKIRGLEIARFLLDRNSLFEVSVEKLPERNGRGRWVRTLRLPESVYEGKSFLELGRAVLETARLLHRTEGSPLAWFGDIAGVTATVLLRGVLIFLVVGFFFSLVLMKIGMALFVVAIVLSALATLAEKQSLVKVLASLNEGKVFDWDEIAVLKRAASLSLLNEIARSPLVLMNPFAPV